MKKFIKVIVSALSVLALSVPLLATACNKGSEGDNGSTKHIDYAGQLELDFTSKTKKQEVTVRLFVDGDTTHFDPVPNSSLPGCNNAADFSVDTAPTKGYAKARYLGVNTPESTGQIEEWGKAASKFTRSKLENATSWIIESNDEKWNIDSTGGRYLLWVWYLPKGETKYRNLNIDILQAGLAYASGIPDTCYATVAQAAIDQAEAEKLYVFSGERDPDYHYGGPINVSMKELRFNAAAYEGKKIAVTGTVSANFNNTAYIEEFYDNIDGYEEDGICIGMPVYYSYTKGKVVNEILQVGNYVTVVGVLQYYETGANYQITDIKAYDRYKPAENCEIIEKVGTDKLFTEVIPANFISNESNVKVDVATFDEDENVILDEDGNVVTVPVSKTYKESILGTSVSMKNLTVTYVSTTTNEESSSYGAMTFTCSAPDGSTIKVRTDVFKDANGKLMTEEDYINKTINVKGVVEYFKTSGAYQIKCYRIDYLEVLN